MGAKHTLGPWLWTDRVLQGDAKYSTYGDMGGFVTADGVPVCWFGDNETYYPTEGTPPNAADARLIASAPDLLEALQGLLTSTVGPEVGAGDGGTFVIQTPSPDALRQARAAIRKATGEAA
jgi:hypothetical protein